MVELLYALTRLRDLVETIDWLTDELDGTDCDWAVAGAHRTVCEIRDELDSLLDRYLSEVAE